jgi:hypothetical protein
MQLTVAAASPPPSIVVSRLHQRMGWEAESVLRASVVFSGPPCSAHAWQMERPSVMHCQRVIRSTQDWRYDLVPLIGP